MIDYLSVETIAVTVMGYPMSWIELVGTTCYLASVVLIAKRQMATWPVGIVAVILYAALFWQIRLYSDALEQAYYLGASVYGWWHWTRMRGDRDQPVPVGYASRASIVRTGVLTAVASVVLGAPMTRGHAWLPTPFPAPAAHPGVDAATTVASLVAMWLTARRRVESWVYWIAIDVVGVWLYHVKGVRFVALLYVVLLALAVWGLVGWHRCRHRGRRAASRSA